MIKYDNSKHTLLKRLKEIREEIPISLTDQSEDIGISIHTLIAWKEDIEDKVPVKPTTVRKIKEYIAKYERDNK